MIKRILILLLSCLSLYSKCLSQNPLSTGKPIAELFSDFHANLNDTSKTTGFGISRAYFGYNFVTAGDFSATVILNFGTPDELSQGSIHRRYAYLREASVSWKRDRINIFFGVISTRLWEFQQKFWEKRYVANTYQAINGYGPVADLGVAFEYKFNDIIKADIFFTNGEGYSDLQVDNSIKTSASMLITPTPELAFRLYTDCYRTEGVFQNTFVGFAGYKNSLITIGAEISTKSNLDQEKGHNAWGMSCTGGINVTKKTQLFFRYDYSTSYTVHPSPEEELHWNILKDGNFAVGGIQYTFNQNVRLALDYQGTYPFSTERKQSDAIYLNALFKF
jgi:hypothetical protein